jgi:simple sugar transport system substrate-binding protein
MLKKSFANRFWLYWVFAGIFTALILACALPIRAQDGRWCEGKTLRFFVGGEEGDDFASIVLRGAQAAEHDHGPTVEYVFSGWDGERMIEQLGEAIAAQPDGIAMMGHPGDEAIMPLAAEASNAGIEMMYQNVDVLSVRASYGGGYIGANLYAQGRALAEEAMRQFDLMSGDVVIVWGPWQQEGRAVREDGTADTFEEAGLSVVRLVEDAEMMADPDLALPRLTEAVFDNPEVRLIVYPGGQMLGATPEYMAAVDRGPGEIINIGFDTTPAVIEAFESGYIQLTSDQQPFLQGYLPILSLCGTLVYGFGPLNVDTGAGFVDVSNFQNVAEQATAGFR